MIFIGSLTECHFTHQRWWPYPSPLVAPDVLLFGYVRNTTVRALLSNLGNCYLLGSLLVIFLRWHHDGVARAIGIIWSGHVGWDRFFGYGLTYDSDFRHASRRPVQATHALGTNTVSGD